MYHNDLDTTTDRHETREAPYDPSVGVVQRLATALGVFLTELPA
jgi:hypothetical protein